MSFLSNLSFQKLFGKKKDTVVGIDLGSSAIKVVQLSKKRGRAVLDTYGALALGPYAGVDIGKATNLPEAKMVEALTDILSEAKISTEIGSVAVPFNSSLMTIVEMPKGSEINLDNMMPLEARKYIPVPISEVSLDWSIISSDEVSFANPDSSSEAKSLSVSKRDKIQVMLVAIHNDVITKFQNIITSASIELEFLEIEIFSTVRSILNLEEEKEPTLILDFGAASTKLYVVERGSVRSSHTINRGSQDVTATITRSLGVPTKEAEILKRTIGLDPEKNQNLYDSIFLTLEYIFVEANRVIREYREKNQKDLSKVILVGGGSSMRGFIEAAASRLKANVSTGDPFSKVDAPAFASEVLRESGPEFATAVGLALRGLSIES
jgi:type IV pilus assembly protein PilM